MCPFFRNLHAVAACRYATITIAMLQNPLRRILLQLIPQSSLILYAVKHLLKSIQPSWKYNAVSNARRHAIQSTIISADMLHNHLCQHYHPSINTTMHIVCLLFFKQQNDHLLLYQTWAEFVY